MDASLTQFIEGLKADSSWRSYDEAQVKQAIILRILSILGWDPFDVREVRPEFGLGDRRVDYSLRIEGKDKVFLEVKRADEDLEQHQLQLLDYSFHEGVPLAVLTNGGTWWFYLPLLEGSWDDRKFYSIDVAQQEASEVASRFRDLLSKENVGSGKAEESARKLQAGRQRKQVVESTLPRAWEQIVSGPDDLLVELVAEATERLCGYKPDNEQVCAFLRGHAAAPSDLPLPGRAQEKEPERHRPRSKERLRLRGTGPVTFKKPAAFEFAGVRREVRTWTQVLLELCGGVAGRHKAEFARRVTGPPLDRYFSRSASGLRKPGEIPGTGVLVETNLSAQSVVDLCNAVVGQFGYRASEFRIIPR